MKRSSTNLSPFIILLIPALLVIGYKNIKQPEISPEKQQVSDKFRIPDFKGIVKAIF